ncbi:hypothetical protein AB0L25_20820 [Spirillospora sp. NPDC052242]
MSGGNLQQAPGLLALAERLASIMITPESLDESHPLVHCATAENEWVGPPNRKPSIAW